MRTTRPFFRKVWLILCDHSVAAVFRTGREADQGLRLLKRNAIDRIEHCVAGPYVLWEHARGQIAKLKAENARLRARLAEVSR